MPYDDLVRTKSNTKFALSSAPSHPHHTFSLLFGHTSVVYLNINKSFLCLGQFSDISVLEKIKTNWLNHCQQRKSLFQNYLQSRWQVFPMYMDWRKPGILTGWLSWVTVATGDSLDIYPHVCSSTEVIHCFNKCPSQACHSISEQGQSDGVHIILSPWYIFLSLFFLRGWLLSFDQFLCALYR